MSGYRLLSVAAATVVVLSTLSAGLVLADGGETPIPSDGTPAPAEAASADAPAAGTSGGPSDSAGSSETRLDEPVADVTILETDDPVRQGDYLQVDFRVNGSVENETARLFIGGELVGTIEYEDIDEDPVLSRGVARTDDVSPGTHELTVRVGNASDSVDVTILERSENAEFAVDIRRIGEPVPAGQLLVVDYTVENVGGANGTQTVSLAVEDQTVDAETLTLTPNQFHEGKLVYRTEPGEVGELNVSVRTANESVTRDVSVEEAEQTPPPSFDFFVSGGFPVDRVPVGEQVTTNGYITNEGGRTGIETLRLRVNNRTVDTDTIVLRPDETAAFDLSYTPRPSELGIVEPTIVGSNMTVDQSFGVVDPSRDGFVRVDVPEQVGPVAAGENLSVPVEVVNIGGETTYQQISLIVDNRTVDSFRPLLDSGQGGELPSPLTYRTDVNETGELTFTVRSENDSVSRTVTVTEPDETENESDGTEEPLYWQVDFGAGAEAPTPPTYWPNDLMAALGNSADGVTESPSAYRARNESQLGKVDIVGNEFTFDDEGNPTEVTVRFELAENATERDLHLAVYTLPGPFQADQVDQQRLFASDSGTYEGGETGKLTLTIPQPGDVSANATTAEAPSSRESFQPSPGPVLLDRSVFDRLHVGTPG